MSLTLGSSRPSRLWNSFLGIMKAAKFAVYKARKTTANKAQMADMNLEKWVWSLGLGSELRALINKVRSRLGRSHMKKFRLKPKIAFFDLTLL